MRDVQVIIDENYLNYHFFTMFYDEKAFSMTEQLLKFIPDSFLGAGAAIQMYGDCFCPNFNNTKAKKLIYSADLTKITSRKDILQIVEFLKYF